MRRRKKICSATTAPAPTWLIYSGAKAIEGPTSGLVIGKTQYVEWVKRQSMGIGRAMKVGKEGILGLTCAIEHYLTASKESGERWWRR
jgi:L-seryl-tRNA(Ser) seleniumtransferase